MLTRVIFSTRKKHCISGGLALIYIPSSPTGYHSCLPPLLACQREIASQVPS